jgi:hypothetical protein
MLMLHLGRGWWYLSLVGRCFLFAGWPRRGSAGAAVIADAVYGASVVDYRFVVNVVNVADVHIIDSLVVIELPSSPITAIVAVTGIAITIVNPTVVADDRTPVAGIPIVQPVIKRPVTRCPEQTLFGGQHPRAGHPVVSIRTPSPVTGRPNIAFSRAKGLLVDRQRRRAEIYGH